MDWFDTKLNMKYETCLQGLKYKFYAFYSILRSLLTSLVEISSILSPSNFKDQSSKELIDNQIHIVKMIVNEFPLCIDMVFCENFLENIYEKLNTLRTNFHPLTHLEHQDKNIQKQLSYQVKLIEDGFKKFPNTLSEIKICSQISIPILKLIESQRNNFKLPISKILEEIKELKSNKIFLECQQILLDIDEKQSQQSIGVKQSYTEIMMTNVKDLCITKLKLEAIFDTPIKMFNIIKSKTKKILNEDLLQEEFSILSRQANIVCKPNFSSINFRKVNVQELIQSMKILEKQKQLISELKKTCVNLDKSQEFVVINEQELLQCHKKWIICMDNIENLQNEQNNIQENYNQEDENIDYLSEQRKYSDRIWDFQKAIMQYYRINLVVCKLQLQVKKFMQKEFNVNVELVCNELELSKLNGKQSQKS